MAYIIDNLYLYLSIKYPHINKPVIYEGVYVYLCVSMCECMRKCSTEFEKRVQINKRTHYCKNFKGFLLLTYNIPLK